MPGFDWNGNGSHDAFDSFMDMKVMSDVSGSTDTQYSDFDDTDADPIEDDTYVGGPTRVEHPADHIRVQKEVRQI